MTLVSKQHWPRWLVGASLALFLAAAPSGTSFAVGGDPDPPPPTCANGKVWDPVKKMCVEKKSGVLPDKALSQYAYALAKEGRYAEALDTLDLLQDPNTPEALNYRGYATRKLGRVEEGIGYYLKAVALDADYTLVREYLGEAYISLGRTDLARDQLNEIEKRCGTTCMPYEELAKALGI